MKKQSKYLYIILMLFIIILATVGVFYDSDRNKIINDMQVSFTKNKTKKILINSITGFEWDIVCALSRDAFFEEDGIARKKVFLGERFQESKIKLPTPPNFYWALVFQKEKIPIKAYTFNKWSTVRVKKEHYSFGYIAHNTKKQYPCFDNESAFFEISDKSNYIYIGGL